MNFKLHSQLSFRFRSWSRKTWAVFASLGRVVTIGTLRVQLSDKSQVKTTGETDVRTEEQRNVQEEDEELLEICLPELECIAIRPITEPACNPNIITVLKFKRLERMYSFQPLLL